MRRLLDFRSKKSNAKAPTEFSASLALVKAAAAVAHGLQVVAKGTNLTVNIIAVHGLNRHREKTWTTSGSVN
ncbi:hypothetical protein T440DRAFT_436398 [Plenodomus tracheiphilus IPT5]|uniref:Uncharacterized protein n=1 Tax=Plenodomus tracheiphilus IPT5 TaxID=1408161 RepID=A0A6A7AQ46_9PLEO|nr:hypothetical protein T440DRAFT_436398 [Plenodomus tracheiphilus IPT5]